MRAPGGLPANAVVDSTYCDTLRWVVPCRCACCVQCWLVVKGKGAGRCVHGGPYLGYVRVLE